MRWVDDGWVGVSKERNAGLPLPPPKLFLTGKCDPSLITFVLQLVKTAALDPSQNYLFGFHPHGVLVVGAFSNFCTEATGFSRLFPGLKPHLLMLPCWFQVPLFRDYIMTSGKEAPSQDPRARNVT